MDILVGAHDLWEVTYPLASLHSWVDFFKRLSQAKKNMDKCSLYKYCLQHYEFDTSHKKSCGRSTHYNLDPIKMSQRTNNNLLKFNIHVPKNLPCLKPRYHFTRLCHWMFNCQNVRLVLLSSISLSPLVSLMVGISGAFPPGCMIFGGQ